MNATEPNATALLLTTCGLLLAVSVVFSRASQRAGVPIALLFLLVGMVAGSEGIGGIAFEDYRFAFRLGATHTGYADQVDERADRLVVGVEESVVDVHTGNVCR